MKTMCRFVAITVLLSVTALIPTTLIAEDGLVSFPDANLEAAVRQAIEKPTGDIHKSDLNGLTNLVANSLGITYIHGLEHCTSLTYLSLWENQINDLYPLAYLSNLRRLNLGNNNITDISRLSYLNGLRQLWLTHNQIINISPLSNLTNLTLLDLSENQITDISSLSNLTGLTELYLRENQIEDISALSGLSNLKWLWLSNNHIEDIAPLVRNPGLSFGDLVSVTANPLNTASLYREIPQLIERGVDVQADSTGMADPASAADNQTDLGLWWLIIIFSLLIITGGIAYYFVLLRRVVKKGFLKQKVKGNQPTTNRQSIDKKRTTGS